MSTEYCLVLCTCPDSDSAHTLAENLVTRRLAACVNILPGLTSVYPWQGNIETASEHLLFIKTESARYAALETFITQNHPYSVPEIIFLPIPQGSPDYLAWISAWLQRGES